MHNDQWRPYSLKYGRRIWVGRGSIVQMHLPPHLLPCFPSHRTTIRSVHPCLGCSRQGLAQNRHYLLPGLLLLLPHRFRRYRRCHLRCRHRHRRRLPPHPPMAAQLVSFQVKKKPTRTSFFSSWSVNSLPIGTSQANPRFLLFMWPLRQRFLPVGGGLHGKPLRGLW